MYTADIKKQPHQFLPEGFQVTDWASLEPYFTNLLNRDINSKADLEQWLKDQSELEAVVSEDACWRQIRMTCDTENKALEESFNYFCMQIQPQIQPMADALNKKLIASPWLKELDETQYHTYLRSIRKSIELFKEENIALQAELAVLQ